MEKHWWTKREWTDAPDNIKKMGIGVASLWSEGYNDAVLEYEREFKENLRKESHES